MTSETFDGPTPHGGVRTVVYYSDDDGNLVDKAAATRAEIVELDARGDQVHRTYGTIDRGQT